MLPWIFTIIQKTSLFDQFILEMSCDHQACHTQTFFDQQLFECVPVHRISGYFTDLFWRCGCLKNPAIWLAENIVYISGVKIFPNMRLVQEHPNNKKFYYRTNSVKINERKFFSKFQKLCFGQCLVHFPYFWGEIFFSRKSGCYA